MAHNAELSIQEGPQPVDPAINDAVPERHLEPQVPGLSARPVAVPHPSSPFVLFLFCAILALVFGMIGACLSLNLFENSSQAAVSIRPNETTAHGEADSGFRAFRSQLSALGRRLDGLKEKFETLPVSDPAPGLATLQNQVADLTKSASAVAPLPTHVDRIDSHLEQLSHQIEILQREVVTLESKLGKEDTLTAPTALPIVAAPRSDSAALALPSLAAVEEPVDVAKAPPEPNHAGDDPDWKRGVTLFNKRRYQAALESFSKLQQSRPEDARVWYYAALSQGFATNQWTESTERLVEKGIQREQAGTPDKAAIDDTFRSLTTTSGKDWLTAYRARATVR